MRRSAAVAAILLTMLLAVAAAAGDAAAQESFAGWRGDPIKRGSGFRFPEGSARVREVQRHLRGLGYALGEEDGRFGALTERAVREFQRRHGLPTTGIVAVATIRELRTATAGRDLARARGAAAPTAIADPGDGADARPTGAEARTAGPSPQPRRAWTAGDGRDGGEPGLAPRPAATAIGVLALAVVAAAARLARRRRRAREEEAAPGEPPALSERIAAMRASGLSPQAVAERIASERRMPARLERQD
jgi:peptidoglycan hydrolase-like protein with peptidoglycan-binding domain